MSDNCWLHLIPSRGFIWEEESGCSGSYSQFMRLSLKPARLHPHCLYTVFVSSLADPVTYSGLASTLTVSMLQFRCLQYRNWLLVMDQFAMFILVEIMSNILGTASFFSSVNLLNSRIAKEIITWNYNNYNRIPWSESFCSPTWSLIPVAAAWDGGQICLVYRSSWMSILPRCILEGTVNLIMVLRCFWEGGTQTTSRKLIHTRTLCLSVTEFNVTMFYAPC